MSKQSQFQGRELCFSEGIRISISLSEVPSEGQFANATAEAQSIALLSLLKLEHQSLHHAVKSLCACSRNLRRSLFAERSILTAEAWPSLRLIGDQKAIEDSLWIYAKEAKETRTAQRETKAEKRIAVLNTLRKESRAFNGYIEVGFEDSTRSAKQEAKQKKVQAKEQLSAILSAIMDGQLTIKDSLLSLLKELVRGENLVTCAPSLRNKVCTALRATEHQACIAFAEIFAGSYDPFLVKAQAIELDTLTIEQSTREELDSISPSAPKAKLTLAEIIAQKRAKAGE